MNLRKRNLNRTTDKDSNVKKLKGVLGHLLNGIWSGIPICCTLHFCKLRWSGIHLIGGHEKKRRGNIHRAQYVQCNKCFELDRVRPMKKNGVLYKDSSGFGRYKRK